jgi:hypothetical protein
MTRNKYTTLVVVVEQLTGSASEPKSFVETTIYQQSEMHENDSIYVGLPACLEEIKHKINHLHFFFLPESKID